MEQQKHTTKKINLAQQAIERAKVQKEINLNVIPAKFNFFEKMFKKTTEEKLQLATSKLQHNEALRKAGFNPKKRLNLSEPVNGNIW